MPDVHRRVPGGEHRDVVLVELGDRLRVVGLELVVGDLVDPGADRLAEQLAARLAADRVGDRADRVGWVDEAEGHRLQRKIDRPQDGKTGRRKRPRSGFGASALSTPGARPMLVAMSLELIHGPPNSGRAGAILAGFARRSSASPCSSSRPPTTSPPSSASSARGRRAASAARSRPSPALAREVARALAVELGPPLSPTQRRALVRAAIVAPRPGACCALGRPARLRARRSTRLIAELQAALVDPQRVRRRRSPTLDDAGLRGRAGGALRGLRRAARRRADAPTSAS